MTERETVLLKEFKEKLDKLIDLQMKVKNENRMLKEALSMQEESVRNLQAQNELLSQKYEQLRMARSVAGMEQDVHDAKIRINKIVREIDQCIAMLNR